MTPKQKAHELFHQMFHVDSNGSYVERTMLYEHAKQCTLLAVDEIWNALESARVFEEYDYWQEVRQEIQKL